MTVNNSQIEADVRTELAGDPRIPYVDEIAVEAYGGAVTLRGTVGSFAQQRAAVADARRTRGVFDVFDELQVRLLNENRRKDAEIRGAALQRLMWNPENPGRLHRRRTLAAIDYELGIGGPTVTMHVEHIYAKLAATSRAEAVELARRAGLLPRRCRSSTSHAVSRAWSAGCSGLRGCR